MRCPSIADSRRNDSSGRTSACRGADSRWEPQAQPPVTFVAILNDPIEANGSLVVCADVFPHLVMPVGPFVTALRAPVVQVMSNAAIPENLRHSVGRPAVLPRTTAG